MRKKCVGLKADPQGRPTTLLLWVGLQPDGIHGIAMKCVGLKADASRRSMRRRRNRRRDCPLTSDSCLLMSA